MSLDAYRLFRLIRIIIFKNTFLKNLNNIRPKRFLLTSPSLKLSIDGDAHHFTVIMSSLNWSIPSTPTVGVRIQSRLREIRNRTPHFSEMSPSSVGGPSHTLPNKNMSTHILVSHNSVLTINIKLFNIFLNCNTFTFNLQMTVETI